MPSGYSATLPDEIILDSAVLFRKVSSVLTAFAASVGGVSFKAVKQYRNVEFDGKRSPIAGLDRITSQVGQISGTWIQAGTAQLSDLEPASSSATVSSVTTITPADASTLIATADLIDTLTLRGTRGDGATVDIVFPRALCTDYELTTQDNNEGAFKATFESRLVVSGGNTDAAPYSIVITAAS